MHALQYDPLVAMMHRGQPMVGAATMMVPPQYIQPFVPQGWGTVPELPPAVSMQPVPPGVRTPIPAYPPGAYPCPPPGMNPCYPMGPSLGYSMFTSPEVIARGMRAAATANVPQKGLGFRTVAGTPVAANTAGVVLLTAATSQVVCPRSLRWHETSAPFFLASSIFVAGREWLTAGGAVPATVFTGDGVCCLPMEFPTVWPGVQISTTVENIDGAPHATFGMYAGIAGDSQPCA